MSIINSIKSIYDVLEKGGWAMIPIIFCSILTLAIIIERTKLLRKYKHNVDDVYNDITKHLNENDFEGAVFYCKRIMSPLTAVAHKVLISFQNKEKDLEKSVDEVVTDEMPKLEKNVGTLGIVANICPLLGLLGTVLGIIRSFSAISQQNLGDTTKLAAGISEALVATASGLIVAIPALAAYNYFQARIDTLSWGMDKIATKLINYLKNKETKNET